MADRRFLCFVGVALVVASWTSALRAMDTRVVSESADGRRLVVEVDVPPLRSATLHIDGQEFTRVEIPGFRSEAAPGTAERLVGTRLLAVPPGARVSLRVVGSRLEDRGVVRLAPAPFLVARYPEGASPDQPVLATGGEEWRWDPRLYANGSDNVEIVKLGGIGGLRNQSVVPLEVRPLVFDARTGRLRLVRQVRVEVTFSGGSVTPGAVPAARDGSWERILGASLVNPRRTARWARPPQRVAQLGTPLKSGLLRPGLLAEDEWKLRVRHTGTTRVPAGVLVAQGFPDGMQADRLRLVLKRYNPSTPLDPSIIEIPIHVDDADSDGLFSSGDSFLFWAEQPRDDATAGERAQRYSFDNVYWLSVVQTGSPARMPVRMPQSGTVPGPTTFPQHIHYEEDLVFDNWVYADSSELYYMLNRRRIGTPETFVAAVPGRAPGSPLTVCVEAQQDWLQRSFQVDIEMQSGANVLLGTHPGWSRGVSYQNWRFVPPPRSIVCDTLDAGVVEPGDITVKVSATPQGHGFAETTPFVDNVQLDYTAEMVASSDAIRFNSAGAAGTLAYSIRGFSGAPVVALDVSDPKAPAVFDLSTSLSSDTLTVTDVVSPGSTRFYDIRPESAVPVLAAADVQQDVADPILDDLATLPPGSVDVLVVAWDGFADDAAMQDWVGFRESQGHRVRVVSTSNAYDAFNGGLLHYDAITRLIRIAYANWGIGAVLLVGDGSEDAAGVSAGSGPNYVPARVKYFPVTSSGGGGEEYRNDMNERHYAKMDGDDDPWPDILVGRFPVSNTQELRNLVDKTLLYEQPAAGDDHSWRKRVLMLSDDEWVKRQITGLPGNSHVRGRSERNFYRSIQQCCDIVDSAFPGDLRCVPFFLHTFSDSLVNEPYNIPEHLPWDWEAMPNPPSTENFRSPHSTPIQEDNYYRDLVTDALADSVGEGCLFLALQTHANRRLVCDESIMRGTGDLFEPSFTNNGKPFVFFGLGCHLNEFGIVDEDAGFYSNDALGEMFLTVPERAAVASYASTGFEYLSSNDSYHKFQLWPAIFEKRWFYGLGRESVDSDTLTSHWLISELIAVAEISNGDVNAINRYCFLGDPLLQLDAGTPRFQVTVDPQSGSLVNGTQLVANAAGGTIDLEVLVADEQGIDSLWVEKSFVAGGTAPIDSLWITAQLDTAASISAKRSWKVEMSLPVDNCDFDLVVGARDVAGRISEFRAGVRLSTMLFANEVPVNEGGVVDARTSFRSEIRGCAPFPEPLAVVVLLDGEAVGTVHVDKVDDTGANWDIAFELQMSPGQHLVALLVEGETFLERSVSVEGSIGLYNVLAYPNPFADWTRIYFEMTSSISGGHLRILDLNGRLVRVFDLAQPGVVQTENQAPGGSIGTSLGWNFVVWDGSDRVGDRVANGVYLYELRIENSTGEALRTRDKVVLMH